MIKAIKGEQIAERMANDFRSVLFDESRIIFERKQACLALFHTKETEVDWPAELNQLSDLNNEDSDRLVVELIPEIGVDKFSAYRIA